MKSLAEFTKTTLIGGVLILLPVYVSILLIAKTGSGLMALLAPVTAQIPAAAQFRQVAAILLIIAVCFLLGLIVRTRPGLRAVNAFEHVVLEKIPGYTLLRSVVGRITGQSGDSIFQPVLVEIEEALAPAFIVEELDDGRCVVMVPSVPTPAAGSLFILSRERVHWVDATVADAIKVISHWGAGAGVLVKAMRTNRQTAQTTAPS